MKKIAIVPRSMREPGLELYAAITYLRNGGIFPRSAAIEKACAVVWVDDEEISAAEALPRSNGFEAAVVMKSSQL
jgi:hypothetical protein